MLFLPGQLIEKQHLVVGQADLAGPGDVPPADQPRIEDRVMEGAKRPGCNQGRIFFHQPHDAEYLGCLNGLLKGYGRQDGRESICPYASNIILNNSNNLCI